MQCKQNAVPEDHEHCALAILAQVLEVMSFEEHLSGILRVWLLVDSIKG